MQPSSPTVYYKSQLGLDIQTGPSENQSQTRRLRYRPCDDESTDPLASTAATCAGFLMCSPLDFASPMQSRKHSFYSNLSFESSSSSSSS